MKLYREGFTRNDLVIYNLETVRIVDVINYPHQRDLILRLSNGILVQVEDWKVEKV